jgi:hypothetical protein
LHHGLVHGLVHDLVHGLVHDLVHGLAQYSNRDFLSLKTVTQLRKERRKLNKRRQDERH